MRACCPQVNAVVFLSNGLLATAAGKVVALWDVNACAMKHTLNHEGTVNALNLNTEGTLLATCGNDRKVTTWNLPKCNKAKELSLDGWVRGAAKLRLRLCHRPAARLPRPATAAPLDSSARATLSRLVPLLNTLFVPAAAACRR